MTTIDAGRPAWTKAGTLLLPIAPALWPPPAACLRLDGVAFSPKRELHVTLVGQALGTSLREAMDADPALRGEVASLRRRFDGRLARLRRWRWLEKPEEPGRVASIIQCIDLPAMATLHAALGALLGRALPVPPPHVTLYTAGRARGIGLPDAETLRRLTVREVSAEELDGCMG